MNKVISSLFLLTFLLLSSVSVFAKEETSLLNYYCHQPEYRCVKVGRGQTWQRMFPDPSQRELVMRLNRMNAELQKFQWIIVPRNLAQVSYMSLSPFPTHKNTDGHKLVVVSLPLYAFAVYDREGNLIHWGPASGGKTWCSSNNNVKDESCETQGGTYKVYRMSGEDCISKTYPLETNGGSSMPWCMFYFKGFAIHGSTLGGFENRSHGCVRLFYEDAQWLNTHFVSVGTRVAIIK